MTHNLLSGLGKVDQVPEKDDLAVAGQATGRDGAGRLLQRHLLVVAVDRLRGTKVGGSKGTGTNTTVSNRAILSSSKGEPTHLLRIDGERATTLAVGAERDADLLHRVLVVRSVDVSATAAVELDVLELREDAAPAGDDALDADEAVEVRLAEVAQ